MCFQLTRTWHFIGFLATLYIIISFYFETQPHVVNVMKSYQKQPTYECHWVKLWPSPPSPPPTLLPRGDSWVHKSFALSDAFTFICLWLHWQWEVGQSQLYTAAGIRLAGLAPWPSHTPQEISFCDHNSSREVGLLAPGFINGTIITGSSERLEEIYCTKSGHERFGKNRNG